MAEPYFKLRQEVHVARNHCASCSELESQMQHPIKEPDTLRGRNLKMVVLDEYACMDAKL